MYLIKYLVSELNRCSGRVVECCAELCRVVSCRVGLGCVGRKESRLQTRLLEEAGTSLVIYIRIAKKKQGHIC